MFATKNIRKNYRWLILSSAFLCMSYLGAQQPEDTDGVAESTDNRHIKRLGEVKTEEWEMDLALPPASIKNATKPRNLVLPDEVQDQQLQTLLSNLAQNPNSKKIIAELKTLLAEVLEQANQLIDTGSINQAEQLLDIIQSVDPRLEGYSATRSRLKTSDDITQLLIAGNAALESGRLLEPERSSALYYFKQALNKDPENAAARQGLSRLQRTLLDNALESARELDFETAGLWLSDATTVQDDQQAVESARAEVSAFKKQRAAELEQKALSAMRSGNFNMADFHIIDLIALGGYETVVESLRVKLEKARFYGGYVPGQIIRDKLLPSGGTAPEVVVIAQGSFLMGSRNRTGPDADHEEPQHRVTLSQGFGMGVREVTVEQFRQFVEQTAYQTTAEQRGYSNIYDESAGRLSRRNGVNWRHDYNGKNASPGMPVLHVSYAGARAYVEWLSKATGNSYRLPSEAEYEYVAKAGGKGSYWWGEESPPEVVENLTGERDRSPSKREWTTSFKRYGDGYWGPGPTGQIGDGKLAHPMGVHDIAGNVSEWTEDCWHQNYVKAPQDGSAWVNPGCDQRVVRGGYWASSPEKSRAAFRFPVRAENYGPVIGFRVARDL